MSLSLRKFEIKLCVLNVDDDDLPGKFWHVIHASTACPLSIVLNTSFNSGKIPTCWKRSYITLIFKKVDPAVSSNYRPVALTSIACKCMESLTHAALPDHLAQKA